MSSVASSADVNQLRLVLLRLARRIRARATGEVTPSQMAVLATLVHHGPCTVGQIAQIEHVRPPSASKIVAGLEEQGLVERRADPEDRRCAHIALSPTGEELLAEARAAGTSWLAARLDALDEESRAAVVAMVPVLEELLGPAE